MESFHQVRLWVIGQNHPFPYLKTLTELIPDPVCKFLALICHDHCWTPVMYDPFIQECISHYWGLFGGCSGCHYIFAEAILNSHNVFFPVSLSDIGPTRSRYMHCPGYPCLRGLCSQFFMSTFCCFAKHMLQAFTFLLMKAAMPGK